MSAYSENVLVQLADEFSQLKCKHKRLVIRFMRRPYISDVAKEHVFHGFLRRLSLLRRCIENVFEALPPEAGEPPEARQKDNATIALHAFYINAFAALDNLAWLVVEELNICENGGQPIRKEWVGLRASNKLVRENISSDFRNYLDTREKWFSVLEDYRHAVAHRIPLYIPPMVVTGKNRAVYLELEHQIKIAFRDADYRRWNELLAEQDALGRFQPVIKHSFLEKSPTLVIHPQMLADFNTIDEIGGNVLAELERH